MAGNTIERVKLIISDLQSSWYFRFWALFWFISALVSFSALIILSEQAKTAQKQRDIVSWFENASSINFPRFHFRMDSHHSNEVFANIGCTFQGTFFTNEPCQSWREGHQPAFNQCQAIWADQITIPNDWHREDNRIECTIVTLGSGFDGNLIMTFELEGTDVFSMAGEAFSGTYFAPNDRTSIILEKNILQSSKKDPVVQLWQSTLLYHSSISQPNYYNASISIGSHFVRHFEPKDAYNSWMAIGDIGGVAFFMVVIHGIAMIVFGLFLTNNSNFLNGSN